MKSSDIRNKFLEFFENQNHRIVPSASLVPADPTMLLTGAGMVPFKPIFLGKEKVDYSRAASCQKCVRTTDIDMIGRTGRHLSFFEMLGNFSFGDYYKKDAIPWSWQFLTQVLKVDPNQLWVTVFESDDEAVDIWRDDVGVADDRIVRLGEKDNFWSAGPTGPCGPCSEIHYDLGADLGCAKPGCAPGCHCDRYLEVWNLVFMQYNRAENGDLNPLPNKSIDTGMGLERISSVLQGVTNNYETDLILPIIKKLSARASVGFGDSEKMDMSIKIVADHTRAITFMISDGVRPGNDSRGYILRRLLRRAIRHSRLLGIEGRVLAPLIDEVALIMEDQYPEIGKDKEFIQKIATAEEERFNNTLRQGLSILEDTIEKLLAAKSDEISDEAVFQLYDTYGFPLELTEEIVAESGLKVNKAGFEVLMEEQRVRARANTPGAHSELYVSNVYHQVKELMSQTEFIGYERESCEAKILALVVDGEVKKEAGAGDKVEVFLDKTPFYAEKGGQIGDAGQIIAETGKLEVENTTAPVAELISHRALVKEGSIKTGQTVTAIVSARRRLSISRNHTATHLLHWALRAVLGDHVKQAGSLVEGDRFRFDYHHHKPLSEKELGEIEGLINEKILQNQPVRAFETTIDYAKKAGALMFFAEKYGQFVRLVEIGNFSKELCGGVHVHNSSEVGFLKIISESGIGANTRRIEALTGEQFLKYTRELNSEIDKVSGILDIPRDRLTDAVQAQTDLVKEQASELAKLKTVKLAKEAERIAAQVDSFDGISLYAGQVPNADANALRTMADQLRAKASKVAVVLGSDKGGKALILVAATPALVKAGFSANSMIKKVAPIIDGVGGGRPDLAQAGGKDFENMAKVFTEAKKYMREMGQGDS